MIKKISSTSDFIAKFMIVFVTITVAIPTVYTIIFSFSFTVLIIVLCEILLLSYLYIHVFYNPGFGFSDGLIHFKRFFRPSEEIPFENIIMIERNWIDMSIWAFGDTSWVRHDYKIWYVDANGKTKAFDFYFKKENMKNLRDLAAKIASVNKYFKLNHRL